MTDLHFRKRKRLLKRLILVAVIFPLVLFLHALTQFLVMRFLRYDLAASPFLTLAIVVFFVTSLYKPVDYLVVTLMKHFLFKSHIAGQMALSQLARESIAILDQHELANMIVNTFGETFGVHSASVLIFDKSKSAYRMIAAFGLNPAAWRNLQLEAQNPLIAFLRARKVSLDQEQVKKLFGWQEANKLIRVFEELHAFCVIPLMFEEELLGTINLRPRTGIKMFSPQEIRAFADFAGEIALIFRNALLMEEVKRSNQELMRIQSDLLRSTQRSAIEHLATGIAHEIHNPLTIISGKAQVLLLKRDQKNYDAQVEEVLKTIVKQTKRAADITRKLLMFSESQRSVKELVDLELVVNDTIALLSYQVSLDQIQVIKRFEHPMPKFEGNVGELREAFLNLFLNAVQAIGKRGTIEVTGRLREQDRIFEFRISDTGPGIPEANLSKLFHPFFTTRPEGTGLGLFVSQQIIHGYHGSIHAESAPSEGSTFVVELPLNVEVPPAASSLPSPPSAETPTFQEGAGL